MVTPTSSAPSSNPSKPGDPRQDALESVAHTAVENKQLSTLELALDSGARPLAKFGQIAIYDIWHEGYKLLLHHGLSIGKLFHADYGGNALNTAIGMRDIEMVTFLLDMGADVNERCYFRMRGDWYPIAEAAYSGSIEMVQLLLDRGAALEGSGALHEAAHNDKVEMMQFLLDKGAEVNEVFPPLEVQDIYWTSYLEDGTPLAYVMAGSQENTEGVELLLERGANPWWRDSKGRSILERSKRV
jgi:ankyrin repeat protein